MQFVIGFIVVVLISLGAGWAYLGTPGPVTSALERLAALASAPAPDEVQKAPARDVRKDQVQDVLALSGGDASASARSPFDIAKVEPNGASVFAGRAAPKSLVTVLADGEPIGTVTADENGEWVLIVERSFANPNPTLSLAMGSQGGPVGQPLAVVHRDALPRTAAAATAQLMGDLRKLVDRARSASRPEAERDKSAAQATPLANAESAARWRGTGVRTAALGQPGEHIIPVPIKFAFREATFTEDGRMAAELLLQYVLLERLDKLKLTGHADERGTPAFNLELSSARLATVARFLRAGGFTGTLELVPMGESAPFTGVDRGLFPPEELFELDRRVELRLRE